MCRDVDVAKAPASSQPGLNRCRVLEFISTALIKFNKRGSFDNEPPLDPPLLCVSPCSKVSFAIPFKTAALQVCRACKTCKFHYRACKRGGGATIIISSICKRGGGFG